MTLLHQHPLGSTQREGKTEQYLYLILQKTEKQFIFTVQAVCLKFV